MFLYRFWLTHKGEFLDSFKSDFIKHDRKKYILNYIDKKLNHETTLKCDIGYHINGSHWNRCYLYGSAEHKEVADRDKHGSPTTFRDTDNKEFKIVKFDDAKGIFISIRAFIECAFLEPSFSNYITPYFLAFIALSGPIMS